MALPSHPKSVVRTRLTAVPRPKIQPSQGIDVQEEELGSVTAQCMYKMRCECGRSWFELELPPLVRCPACAKLCLVSE
jgi:hypothetical protein